MTEDERSLLTRLKSSLTDVKDQLQKYEAFFEEAKEGTQVISVFTAICG